jgi:ActR/RegA family two-component response regulator/anti-sigma regulatory factor (Ser/Thr protein kinase)/putative methionine-R-sulfoxide reductase with GAF domain
MLKNMASLMNPDHPPHVLLVEDDDAGRSMLAEVLDMSGYCVVEAAGCEEAYKKIKTEPIAIAIVDLHLPDGNGIDLMHDLRREFPKMTIIISTGHGTMQTAVDALNQGANAYLLKPYEPQALLAALRQATEKWRLENQNQLLLKQSRAENERVTALLQASEEINSSYMDTTGMSRRIVQTAVRIMAANAGFIGLRNGDAIQVHEWWDGLEWQQVEWNVREGEGAPGYVWQSHQTYRSEDVRNDPRLLTQIARTLNQRTRICCPLLTRYGEFLGVLDLSNKNGGEPFNDSDARFLEGLCRHIVVALENNRLYEEQRRAEELRKQFFRDVVSAATHNKLVLCDTWEMETPEDAALFQAVVTDPQDLAKIREGVARVLLVRGMTSDRSEGVQLCVGEATTNALKHGGGGEILVWANEEALLIRVEDHGPGIDATTLPKATLLPGFSTKASLGMGLTIILEFVDQVRLSTNPNGTRLDMVVSWNPIEKDPLEGFDFSPDL